MKDISSKKVQIDKGQATIFATVAIASVVTIFSLVSSKSLWSNSRYLAKVIDKKETARDQLEENKATIGELTKAYEKFDNQETNLMGGSKNGTTDRDGSNGTLILNALPNTYDFPALASSIEKMLAGYQIDSITGSDDIIAQSSSAQAQATEIPFSFTVTTNYSELKRLVGSFDKSIRPFSLTKIEFSGNGDALKVDIAAKTYYQPNTSLKITEETVK